MSCSANKQMDLELEDSTATRIIMFFPRPYIFRHGLNIVRVKPKAAVCHRDACIVLLIVIIKFSLICGNEPCLYEDHVVVINVKN